MKIFIPFLSFFTILILLSGCKTSVKEEPDYLLLKGGTLIDVSGNGKNSEDILNSYILIENDKIISAGNLQDAPDFPENATIIDASDKYILPGLIDGFAVMNNQAYANAFLYMGVTTILGVYGGRRGPFFPEADPAPDFFLLESVGDDKKSTEEHIADLEKLYNDGFKIVLLKYALTPDQVKACKEKAWELEMGCIGELGYTTYKEAVDIGVEVFVHTTRYSMDVAPRDMAQAVADQPFSDDLNSPKWKYYQYLYKLEPNNEQLIKHAKVLGNSNSYLMPTLSLLYLDLPAPGNPWEYPVAKILNEDDINNPADKVTGKHNYTEEVQRNYTAMGIQEFEIEKKYFAAGAKYLAGSATDVWGTMPGISLHTELKLLSRLGLSNREVIATATSNFHDAFGWKAGQINNGFTANILVLDNNPLEKLENLTDIHALILNGKIIDRNKLLEINKNIATQIN